MSCCDSPKIRNPVLEGRDSKLEDIQLHKLVFFKATENFALIVTPSAFIFPTLEMVGTIICLAA